MERERRKASKEQRPKPLPFSITQEQLQGYEYSSYPISASAIARKINFLVKEDIDAKKMKRFSYRNINYWLREIGMIEWREWGNGKRKRFPTSEGEAIGLILEIWENYGKRSPVIYFSKEAEQFVIDNIEAVIAAEKGTISDPQDGDEKTND